MYILFTFITTVVYATFNGEIVQIREFGVPNMRIVPVDTNKVRMSYNNGKNIEDSIRIIPLGSGYGIRLSSGYYLTARMDGSNVYAFPLNYYSGYSTVESDFTWKIVHLTNGGYRLKNRNRCLEIGRKSNYKNRYLGVRTCDDSFEQVFDIVFNNDEYKDSALNLPTLLANSKNRFLDDNNYLHPYW
ncbi:hypothetical protein H312_01201 [Anncaliia algerae PRA339]|uniref:Ricin B lectin domain-containing protein n=1 Tax=Anncaliia algerae PRA339 TaxID=1288291 RepID=A0A059F2I6_9MICR|nr:hypothetical protein H312_01201 [Anncaliia algerae PRA339]